jgi:nucleotide-binding universal stress UspA family protein
MKTKKMKTVIASTDFSPTSLNAVNYAADMAVAINATIFLFHAYSIPVSYSEIPLVIVSVEELKQESEKKLEELKESLLHVLPAGIKIETESRLGNTVDELENICQEIKPFAVVIGAKGKSNFENLVYGSVALTAIRHLEWPVVCVPAGKEYGRGIKKIGFACDFKQVKKTTPVQKIKAVVGEFKASLQILNVDNDNKHFDSETPSQMYLLNELFNDVNPEYHFINNPDVEDGINEFAETNNLDLLIAIPLKHKLLDGIFKPSSTKQLIFQSHIPVMCLHQ